MECSDTAVAATPRDGTVLRSELRGACVLLVEDSDIVRDVSRSVLEDAGVIVDEAIDGAVAVAMMAESHAHYDLILMDVQMPRLDGISATRQIRAALGEQAPPIIALTANVSAAERLRCSEAGMIDHLPKPLDPAQLIAALNRWLVLSAGGETVVPDRASDAKTPESATAAAPVLPDIPGFELQAGLACVGGKAALLQSMLARFGVTYASVVQQLKALLDAQNYRETRRVAHTLKGAAATLGGMAISTAAERVEEATRRLAEASADASGTATRAESETASLRAQVAANLAELEAALQPALPVLQGLRPRVNGEHPVKDADLVRDPLPEALVAEYAALRELLAENCYAARKAFGALQEKLGADDREWRAACAAMDALDFQQALTHLDKRYPANARPLS